MTKTMNHLDVNIFAEIEEENYNMAALETKIKVLLDEFDEALDNEEYDYATTISADLVDALNEHDMLVDKYVANWSFDCTSCALF